MADWLEEEKMKRLFYFFELANQLRVWRFNFVRLNELSFFIEECSEGCIHQVIKIPEEKNRVFPADKNIFILADPVILYKLFHFRKRLEGDHHHLGFFKVFYLPEKFFHQHLAVAAIGSKIDQDDRCIFFQGLRTKMTAIMERHLKGRHFILWCLRIAK